MFDVLELILRLVKGEELTWQEVDTNWQRIMSAINYLLKSKYQKDLEDVGAGELVITHDFGLIPQRVIVWQKVIGERWVMVGTPDVSYLEEEETQTVRINFPEAPGSIRVMIRF